MQHQARKRFGQNFLVDSTVVDRIINSVNPAHDDKVVEIGPGPGALTKPLLHILDHIDVIELDRDIIPGLSQLHNAERLTIHNQDVLKFDFGSILSGNNSLDRIRVIGNLPYNISTAVLFYLVRYRKLIKDMHFMLQKEVVDRIAAPVGSSNYGRLSVMMQLHFRITPLFPVPPQCFKPAPKVDSAVIRLTPLPAERISDPDYPAFEELVRTAFSKRRKTLRNTLKPLFPDGYPDMAGIDFGKRPQELSVADYICLLEFIKKSIS